MAKLSYLYEIGLIFLNVIVSTGLHGSANHQTSFFMAENNSIVRIYCMKLSLLKPGQIVCRADGKLWLLEVFKDSQMF